MNQPNRSTSDEAGTAPWQVPNTWRWAAASEVTEIVGGGTPRTNEPANFDGGDIPWITPADLSGYRAKTISKGSRNITKRGLESSGARMMPAGTVLFSSRAPIGYVAIAANPVSTNQGFKSFIPAKELDPEFLYYYLQRAKQLALDRASGTTFLELSGKKAATLPITIAPLAEQRRIVEAIEAHFTQLDAAVAALERVRANLTRYRASVLKAAFGALDGVDEKPLFEMVADLDGKRRPINADERATRQGNVPYFGATGQVGWINESIFDEDLVLLGEDGVDFLNPFRHKAYSIHGPAWVNNHAHVLRPLATVVRQKFLEYGLNQFSYAGIVGGTTRLKLTKSAMRGIALPCPSLDVQDSVVAEVERRLSVADSLTTEVETGLKRCARMRQAVLKTAFEGRLVPQDSRDEAAAAMLQRRTPAPAVAGRRRQAA